MTVLTHDVRRVSVRSAGAPWRTVLAALIALLVGLGGTLLVTRLLSHSSSVARTSAAQYLPSAISRTLQAAPDFNLADQNGQLVSLSSLRGQPLLVTFMDPQCTQQCPILGQELGAVERALPSGVKPVLIVVSVAAGRNAADVSNFMTHETWHPGWHWLLGNQAQLQAVWASYHVAVAPTTGDVLHDVVAYIVDPQGRLVAGYSAPLPVGEVTSLITTHSTR